MAVNRATMMTSERRTSTPNSNTRDQRLLRQHSAGRRVLGGDGRAERAQVRDARGAQTLGQAGHDAPVGAGVSRRGGTARLSLRATFPGGGGRRAVVWIGHRAE